MRPFIALFAAACAFGCSDADPDPTPSGMCTPSVIPDDTAGAQHVEACSELQHPTLPPAAGNHYPSWAAFRTYGEPVPFGFLIHSLEHGAVVMLYDCPEGCEDVVRGFAKVIDEFGDDPKCSSGVRSRFIIAPEPSLDQKVAVIAWGQRYLADCFDEATLTAFVTANYGKAPEDLCAPGQDLSGAGWCP